MLGFVFRGARRRGKERGFEERGARHSLEFIFIFSRKIAEIVGGQSKTKPKQVMESGNCCKTDVKVIAELEGEQFQNRSQKPGTALDEVWGELQK